MIDDFGQGMGFVINSTQQNTGLPSPGFAQNSYWSLYSMIDAVGNNGAWDLFNRKNMIAIITHDWWKKLPEKLYQDTFLINRILI